jgi:hypothetical protein
VLVVVWGSKAAISKILSLKGEPKKWFIRNFQREFFK